MRHTSLRHMAEVTATIVAIAAIVAVATRSVGEGEQLRTAQSTAQPASAPNLDPPRFGKQALIGTYKTPPTTGSATSTTGGRLRPAGTETPAGDAAPVSTTGTAPPSSGGAPPPAADQPPADPGAEPGAEPGGLRCLVRLHGKGGGPGGTRTIDEGLVEVAPGGNGAAWGGREWMYFPDSGYAAARANVTAAIDATGCGRVIVNGFSNGGAFAAKLYCRGETFGGRLIGVIIDDPVVDHAVEGCRPAGGVRVALYWTGALDATAVPGWNCAEQDWTCEGGTTIGIDAYEGALGVARRQSVNATHAWYQQPPELSSWW